MKVGSADVQGLIFDFDGTLADSMWVWSEVDRKFFESRGISFDADASEMIAVLGFEGGSEYVVEHFGLDEDPAAIIEEWKQSAFESYATRVMLKPGAREYLQSCKDAGLPLAIATSLQRHLLEASLENNGLAAFFDAVCICDELQCGGKSSPAVYLEAAKRIGVDIGRCAIFEDVCTAARSAKESGAYVVGVYDQHKQQATDELCAIVDLFIEGWPELL